MRILNADLGERDVQNRRYYVCRYTMNTFRPNSRAWCQWDVVHYIQKQCSAHVLEGLGVPPCQHDRSLLHTEGSWWLEVGAAAEEWCIPRIIAAELLSQRKLMSPPCDDDTQRGVTYDVCTNSKHMGWGRCAFWLFYVGRERCAGAQRGRKDVFHATHKGRKNNALEMRLLVSQEITMQSYVVHVRDIEPWKTLRSCVLFLFCPASSHTFLSGSSLFIESRFAKQECYKSLLTRRKMAC